MRLQGTGYRAHDPRWAFAPTSGAGAAKRGGRFNRQGVEALYLAMTAEGAIHEILQGFAMKMEPCMLCSYDVDCDDIVDLSTEASRDAQKIDRKDLSGAWMGVVSPPSWGVADKLIKAGFAGILVPSFAVGARTEWVNLVLWKWSNKAPHRVMVNDPDGRLPKDQSSWR